MNMTLRDRSLYFTGLLLLTRKDNIIADEEKAILLRLGELLQFNHEFCENTIQNILKNPHMNEEPPLFSNREFAEMFLLDGIKMAFADHNLHKKEYDWMQEIAEKNSVSAKWLAARLSEFLRKHVTETNPPFEIETFTGQQLTVLSTTV